MLENALYLAEERLLTLPWLERYGGLARPVRIPTEEGTLILPVRRKVTALQCTTRGHDLVPNSAYKSLAYVEQLTDFVNDPRNTDTRQFQYRGRARLMYWLNLYQMGVEQAEYEAISGKASTQLIATLSAKAQAVEVPQPARVTYDNFSVPPVSAQLFERYSYPKGVDALLLWPYDFGAVDFDVTYTFAAACLDTITLKAPLVCPPNW